MGIEVAARLLESHGSQRTSIPDMNLPCQVYSYDPLKDRAGHGKYDLNRELGEAGFDFADFFGAAFLEELLDGDYVTPTSDLRGKAGNSKIGDRKVIASLRRGQAVHFQSESEKARITKQLKPGMVMVELTPEMLRYEEVMRAHIQAGQAILLVNPQLPRIYGLLMEKPPAVRLFKNNYMLGSGST
ncbi:MAG: hypothetical protein HY438_03310 [DPANN group archaeon]|nr:hypothetical protein [DPANN group archaeon]